MQRQTRTSITRFDQEAENVPPTKKRRVEDTARRVTKQTNGNTTTVRGFDTSPGEFKYTRKPKKATKPQPPPPPIVEQPSRPEDASPQPDAKPRGRKRKSRSIDGAGAETATVEPARRSKRISGETTRPATRPPDEDKPLHVERKRRETKIALPFQDTPVIQRNKEMRQASAANRRRSSSTFRGRRASSLIDSGTSNAVPHSTVATAEFYKHISHDLPEPRRMKQLLTWCGSRALTERPPAASDQDSTAILAARTIQDEIVQAFADRSEMSDWFSRNEEVTPTALVKKPHPRNVQNVAKLVELEAEVERLEREKSQWDHLLSGLSSQLDAEIAATKEDHPPDPAQLDPEQRHCLDVLADGKSNTATRVRARLQTSLSSVEFKIDTFAEGVHKLSMLDEVAREAADGVMAGASAALDERRDAALARTGGAKGTVGDVLRALSQERKQ